MGKFSLANLFGMTIRESANDGSDFTNPDADYRRLFLGEDGLLHVKDSAGAVTSPYSAGGTSLNPGTSFPGGPSNNDLCYRTDRDLLYFYDGTRWLTVNLYIEKLGAWNNITSASGQDSWHCPPTALGYDIWMETLYAAMESSSITGSAYWTIGFNKRDGGSSTSLATVSCISNTNSVMVQETAAVNALLGVGVEAWFASITKTSTPGALFASASLSYRLVG